jgi:hypothetical protein
MRCLSIAPQIRPQALANFGQPGRGVSLTQGGFAHSADGAGWRPHVREASPFPLGILVGDLAPHLIQNALIRFRELDLVGMWEAFRVGLRCGHMITPGGSSGIRVGTAPSKVTSHGKVKTWYISSTVL